MTTLITFIHYNIGSPGHCNQTRKRDKGIQIGKEKEKLSLPTDYKILCIQNLKSIINC